MKYAIRVITILLFLAGGVVLQYLSIANKRLSAEVLQLEAELGRMTIEDADRVYLVKIGTTYVPPEVASHVDRIWQYRCYLPPGYDYMVMSGSGRVAQQGVYLRGGFSSSWGMPSKEAVHTLLTVSCKKEKPFLKVFLAFDGAGGSSSFNGVNLDRFDAMVVQELVSGGEGPRSFDQETILPLLKIYDPSSAEDKEVAGQTLTAFAGGLIVLCPKSREDVFNELKSGRTPVDFEPSWVATEVGDE